MPNLDQIQALRDKYSKETYNRVKTLELKFLNESFNKSLYDIEASFKFQNIDDHIIPFFEKQQSADIILLFIDITDFSKKCSSLTNLALSQYLDNYYDIVIPMIYKHGGEVEKIIGDGIICVFGEPFLSKSKDQLLEKADQCAKDIIIELKGSDKEVKIALNDGMIMYYKNKTQNYPEYTMIGNPLTELFRLESVSINNSINYFYVNSYDSKKYSNSGVYCMSTKNICSWWNKSQIIPISLKGISWSYIKAFECTSKSS